MRKKSLTEARVRMLKPRKTARDVRDGKLRGFGVRVLPSGKERFFIHCQYAEKRIWKVIGSAGAMTVGEARLRAGEMLAAIRRGEGLPVAPEEALFETIEHDPINLDHNPLRTASNFDDSGNLSTPEPAGDVSASTERRLSC